MNDDKMTPNTTPRSLYNVTILTPGDPGATPEIVNLDGPLGIAGIIGYVVNLVNEHIALGFKSSGPIAYPAPGIRQRYELTHNDGRRVVVDVVKAQEATS